MALSIMKKIDNHNLRRVSTTYMYEHIKILFRDRLERINFLVYLKLTMYTNQSQKIITYYVVENRLYHFGLPISYHWYSELYCGRENTFYY